MAKEKSQNPDKDNQSQLGRPDQNDDSKEQGDFEPREPLPSAPRQVDLPQLQKKALPQELRPAQSISIAPTQAGKGKLPPTPASPSPASGGDSAKSPYDIEPLPSAPRPRSQPLSSLGSAAPEPLIFTRAKWKHATRLFGVFVLILLNISLVMSDVERYHQHRQFILSREIITYLVLVFFDFTILLPLLFEVNLVEVKDDMIILKTIFYTAKIKWQDIVYFKKPPYLKFGVVRTARCIYLINKRDIKRFDELAEILMARTNLLEG